MDKEEALYASLQQRVQHIHRVGAIHTRIAGRLNETYGWKENDLRRTYFQQLAQLLSHTEHFYALTVNQMHVTAGNDMDGHKTADTAKAQLNRTLAYLYVTTWLATDSVIHDKYTQLLQALKVSAEGNTSELIERLAGELDLEVEPKVLKLYGLTRQSIYGAGFYYRGKERVKLTYQNKAYTFRPGRLKFDAFLLLFHLLAELAPLYLDVVGQEVLLEKNFLWDKHYRKQA